MKGIRGAIAPVENSSEAIGEKALALFTQVCQANNLNPDQIVLVIFTCTQDLTAAYPAKALREAGYVQIPMLCVQEQKVDNSLSQCIRILVLVEDMPVASHVYIGEARRLRPDWVGETDEPL
ncbi:MAG: chorismate mutase [Bacillota bacterium]